MRKERCKDSTSSAPQDITSWMNTSIPDSKAPFISVFQSLSLTGATMVKTEECGGVNGEYSQENA